jgi:alcohol dehydrogenase (cytochrome c)
MNAVRIGLVRLGLAGLGLAGTAMGVQAAAPVAGDWPGYNNTLTSERHSPLREIDAAHVHSLEILCTFDTAEEGGFQTGLIEVGGTLFGTTEKDTFALDPSTCRVRWRAHEEFKSGFLKVNRGIAWADGKLFRGTRDGRLVSYDAATGAKLWETQLTDPRLGDAESIPAAPIVWQGLVFVGNAGGDNKGVKGRMYALDAATGKIRWQTWLVPKDAAEAKAQGWGNAPDVPISGGATWTSYTLDPASGLLYVPGGNPAPDFDRSLRPGPNANTASIVVLDAKSGAFRTRYPVSPGDFHDWDVSTPPILATTRGGRHIVAVAPKDGHLHAFDLGSGHALYHTPVTRIENATEPLSQHPVHFCPGPQGGSEWNGPDYDPTTNLLYTGAVDWCATVTLQPVEKTRNTPMYQPWSANDQAHPDEAFGKLDPPSTWAGWVYATDADSGKVVWKFKTPYPVMSGVTSTDAGLVFVGDMGGTLYAFDCRDGRELWSKGLGGALGGGVITYSDSGKQRVAVAVGMTSPIWPTQKTTEKVVVLGLR